VNFLSGGLRDVPAGMITVEREADGHVLYLSGDVDAAVVAEAKTEQTLEGLRILAVDVGALTYIDSSGLTLLVRWAQNAKLDGRPAEIRHTTKRFDRVLEVAGLNSLFVRT
jgi:anti-anti-sigma factor